MAIGHMMHHLADGPAAWAIGSIQLLIGKAGDHRFHSRRSLRDLLHEDYPILGTHGVGKTELSNGITKVRNIHGSKDSTRQFQDSADFTHVMLFPECLAGITEKSRQSSALPTYFSLLSLSLPPTRRASGCDSRRFFIWILRWRR